MLDPQNVTRIPFEHDPEMWIGDEVGLYRLEEAITNSHGEGAADYVLVSSVNEFEGEPAESVIFAVEEDGSPLGFIHLTETADQVAALAEVNLTDVTSEG